MKILLLLSAGIACIALSSVIGRVDAAAPATETVVVSASPVTPDGELATLVESVSRDEILRAGGANLADALANTPGVSGTGFASGASRPVIRGFDANRVRVLEDGIGSFDVSDVGPDHGVPIDPLSAERIEVIRGAATLRYGSQAIGGVVNAINNRVPLRLPDSTGAELSSAYGTNAETRQGSALFDSALGNFAFHADGFLRRAQDYDTPLGTLGNSFFDGGGFSLGSSYFFGPDRVGAALVHYDSRYGIPGEANYIDMRQTKEMFRSSFAPQLGALQQLNVDAGYADYQHSERTPEGIAASTFKDREWDARAETLFGASGPFVASALGVQLQEKNFSALGEGADYLLPARTRSAAAFAFGDTALSPGLHLHTGLRIESVDIDGTPASDIAVSRSFTPLSASVGMVLDTSTALRWGLTLSSAARAPAQTELFARGPHDGTATFETGDPGLGVERATSLEATLRIKGPKARFEGALWAAKFHDYIYGELTGRSCDDAGDCVADDSRDLQELRYRKGGALFRGAEAKAVFDVHETVAGTLQVTTLADYVRATLDDDGNVPRIAPYHIGAGLTWAGSAWKGSDFDASVLVKYTGRQNEVATSETPTPGFVSLDAQAAWRPFSAHPGIEFALLGRNLTDTLQRNATALNKDEVPQPGREVKLMARMHL